MSKTLYNHTSAISFPTAVYPDRFRTIKQYRSNLEQGYAINNILALQSNPDVGINNFSSKYITKPTLLSDITQLSALDPGLQTTITKLSFRQNDDEKSLYIYNTAGADENGDPIINTTLNQTQRAVGIKSAIEGVYNNNFFFEIEFLSDNLLRIKHVVEDGLFVLNWDPGSKKFVFLRETTIDLSTETNSTFRYNIDKKGRLFLFKCLAGETYSIVSLDDKLTAVNIESVEANSNNTIYIDLNYEEIFQLQNNDFVSYRTGAINTLSINNDRSLFDQKGQYLFHTEYNDFDIDSNQIMFNFFTLDTNRSEYGFIKRGTNMVDAPDDTPTFNYRAYNTLDTGLDQEQGNDKLSLAYTFYDKDIAIKNGTTTVFKAPESIYPFDRLNINDTTFIKNGALSGPEPVLSDRIYIKRTQTDQYENGRFLCTWLSANSFEEPGVWVDRYYYPDVISKRDALFGLAIFEPSFNDSVDTLDRVGNSSSGREQIEERKFFDKISDAAITSNVTIKYDRLGNQDMEDVVLASTPIVSGFDSCTTSKVLRITRDERYLGLTENLCKINTSTSISLDGTFYSRVSAYKEINKNKAFTISFDASIDPEQQYGYELIGNNTNMGFGVFQDMTVTPFLHLANGSTLNIYNTDGVKLNAVDFERPIRDVFKLSALQDFIVVCDEGYVYQVDAKGNKVELIIIDDLSDEYISSFMEENDIYFLFTGNVVKRLKIQNSVNSSVVDLAREVQDIFKVTTLPASDVKEFNAYSNVTVPYNEGVLRYNDTVYLYPGCGSVQAWETDDIVFYTVRSGEGVNTRYNLIKHNLKEQPVLFAQFTEEIIDMSVEFRSQAVNVIAVAHGNKITKYNTAGGFITENNFDNTVVEPETEGADAEYPLRGGRVLALDYINEYKDGGVNNTEFVVAYRDADGNIRVSPESEISGETLSDAIIEGINNDYVFTPITNYNRLARLYDSKSLDFRLTLKNSLNHRDTTTQIISYDQTAFDAGVHTFTFSFDSIQGNITLYVDGILYENRTVPPGKYDLHDIFSGEIYVGTAGFVNDIDLSTYLKQPGQYYINDLSIDNLYIYDNAASKILIIALALRNRNIDELVLSIPHGQRNNKATIERFYKYGNNGSSNKVDIIINNFDVTDEDILSQIRLNILEDAETVLPAGVEINNIKFSK